MFSKEYLEMTKFVGSQSLFGLFLLVLVLFIPQTAFCQSEKLGIVQYTPPKGMTKTLKANVVAFSEFNKKTGMYCIITVYGATPGTGAPLADFKREWNNLVLKEMKADEAAPKTDSQKRGEWTAVSGGSIVETNVGKAVGYLTVISNGGRVVSVLALFNDPSYATKADAFIGSIEMDKSKAPANTGSASGSASAPGPPTLDRYGNLFISPPTRQLTVADLVGNWGDNPGRIATTYVYKSDGAYAGTDSLHYTSKSTIDADGRYGNDFFEVRNGQKLRDITTGSVSIQGRVLTIKQKGTTKYYIRGWLELADMTIMKLIGPWPDNQEIPANIFTNPEQGENLSHKWIRLK